MEGIFTIKKPKAPTELTQREAEVLNLMAEGHNNTVIANRLFIDVKTIHHHINSIYSKVKSNNDTEGKNMRVLTVLLYLLLEDKLNTQDGSESDAL